MNEWPLYRTSTKSFYTTCRTKEGALQELTHSDEYSPEPFQRKPKTPSQQPASCPECGNQKMCLDGTRHLADGRRVQRHLCPSCGYRFSQPSRDSFIAEGIQKVHTNLLKSGFTIPFNRRVCEALTEGSKNLTTVEIRTQEWAAGAKNDTKSLIFQYVWHLKKQGYSEATIQARHSILKILVKRGVDLLDPESVKMVIASQEWSTGRKSNTVDAYSSFPDMTGGTWRPQPINAKESYPSFQRKPK